MRQARELASEKALAEEMILMYFNNYLYDMGVISEDKRNKMIAKIAERGSSKTKKNRTGSL